MKDKLLLLVITLNNIYIAYFYVPCLFQLYKKIDQVSTNILFYKVLTVFGLSIKILITTEPIELSILRNNYICPLMILSYIIFNLCLVMVLGYFTPFLP